MKFSVLTTFNLCGEKNQMGSVKLAARTSELIGDRYEQGFKKTAMFYAKYLRQQTVLLLAGGTKNFKKVALFQTRSYVTGGKTGMVMPSEKLETLSLFYKKYKCHPVVQKILELPLHCRHIYSKVCALVVRMTDCQLKSSNYI